MPETIIVAKSAERTTITLSRPEARNGITQTMLDELFAALKEAAADEQLRVLVLTGAGRDFCPGADVKAYAAGAGGKTNIATFQVSALLHSMPAVTIAAIRGACAGAGLGWAAACDLRVASETARFNTAFLDVALSGDMGGPWTLSRILGAAKARELYFLPGKFDAAEALRIGLVSRVWADDQYDAELEALAARLESQLQRRRAHEPAGLHRTRSQAPFRKRRHAGFERGVPRLRRKTQTAIYGTLSYDQFREREV